MKTLENWENVWYILKISPQILSDYYSAWHGRETQWIFVRTIKYSWYATHGCSNTLWSFSFYFFLVLCLERSSLAVVKLCHIQESLGDLFTTQSAGPHPWSFWFKRSAWGLRSHTSNTQRWCSAAGAWPTFWEPCSLYHDERVTIHLRAKKCSSPLILRSFDSHLFNRLEQLLYAAQASTKDAREKNVLRLFVLLSECGSQD